MAPSKRNAWASSSSKRRDAISRTHVPSKGRNHGNGVRTTTPPMLWTENSITCEQYAEHLRARSLPESLAGGQLDRFRSNVLSVVEGLYRDRISPTLGEVQKRLRRSGWGTCDVQAVLPVCACEPDTYELLLPSFDEPPRILLRSLPPGFIDADMAIDVYSQDAWAEVKDALKEVLKEGKPDLLSTGGCEAFALKLQRHLAQSSRFRTEFALGELLHMVKLSLGRPGGLAYDESHGGRLQLSLAALDQCAEASSELGMPALPPVPAPALPTGLLVANEKVAETSKQMPPSQKIRHTPTPVRNHNATESDELPSGDKAPSAPRAAAPRLLNKRLQKLGQISEVASTDDVCEAQRESTPTCTELTELGPEGVAECMLKILQALPLPQEFLCQEGLLQKSTAVLRKCVESLYRDRILPTLEEIHQRLGKSGWGVSEVQGALLLCARDPEQYRIEMPRDDHPLCIFLCTPPSWFNGWNSSDTSEGARADLRAACLDFKDSLRGQEMGLEGSLVLPGTIQEAALELRQRSLPELQHLALGEVQEIVKHLTEQGYFKFEGRQLRLVMEPFMSEQSESDSSLSDEQVSIPGDM